MSSNKISSFENNKDTNNLNNLNTQNNNVVVSNTTELTSIEFNKGIKLPKKDRMKVFIIITLMNIILNMDHGTIPSASNEIKESMKISETTLGTFGSLVYLGVFIGALVLTKLIDSINRKYLSLGTMLICALMLFSFTQIDILVFLFANRIIVGIMQSFITIYMPVWVDQFGMRSWKTVMLSIFNITSPLGVMIGYVLTMIVKTKFNWKYSYIIQSLLLVLLSICCFLTNNIYYSKKLYQINKFTPVNSNKKSSVPSTKNSSNKIEITLQSTENKEVKESQETKDVKESDYPNNIEYSIDNEVKKPSQNLDVKVPSKTIDEDNESIFGEGEIEGKESVFKKFGLIVKEPVYIFTCIAITTLLFISTAVIFWASDFAINVIHADNSQVFKMFVIVSLTGPVLGIIIGGAIVEKYAGGYEGKHSITFSIVFATCAFCSALPIGLLESLTAYGIMLWSVLFFGGAVIPNIQGIMISSLKKDLRAAGNSISNILQNLIGFLPAPMVYGFIFEKTKDSNPKLAMTLTLWYSGVGIIFLLISYYYRNIKNKLFNKKEQEVIDFNQINNNNLDKKTLNPNIKNFKPVNKLSTANIKDNQEIELKIKDNNCKTETTMEENLDISIINDNDMKKNLPEMEK